MTPGGLLARVN